MFSSPTFPRSFAPRIVALVLLAFAWIPGARADGIPEKAPHAKAKSGTWYAATSKGGLHFAWKLPSERSPDTPANLTVILHGTGLDWRWGPANHDAETFRAADVVVSVDGTSPGANDSRLFLDGKKDVEAFAAFLEEMRAAFATRDTYLYGHSQGGFFVVLFAGEHPEAVAGVVAHASGAWAQSKMAPPVRKVAIAFQHGTADPVVPYGQSVGSRDAYVAAGFGRVHLRRLHQYNHWPNAVRTEESLDWCEGMTTDDPARALACARAILEPKKPDSVQWTTVVGFGAARDVLRRLEGTGPAPFADVDPKVASAAADVVKKLEAHAAKHVAALEKLVGAKKDLTRSGAWVGHLVPLREDFRGVEAVEAFVKKIGYDDARKAQDKAARTIFEAFYSSQDGKKSFEAIVGAIDGACLVEGFPADLGKTMDEWKRDAKRLGIGKKPLESFARFEAWRDGWSQGYETYEALWKEWKGP